jgi:serine/threonine protein kinase
LDELPPELVHDADSIRHTACEVATILHDCHRHGVIHHDLKPDHVMFDPSSRTIKLIDFDYARFIPELLPVPEDACDHTKYVPGTVGFVPLGTEPCCIAIDAYSLGQTVKFWCEQRGVAVDRDTDVEADDSADDGDNSDEGDQGVQEEADSACVLRELVRDLTAPLNHRISVVDAIQRLRM